jgi:hypothetical protein
MDDRPSALCAARQGTGRRLLPTDRSRDTHVSNLRRKLMKYNGDFEGGGGSVPTGWTALNAFGAAAAGRLVSGCGVGGSACWYDGSVQGYDGLNQSIATAIGATYDVTFSLNDTGRLTTFQQLSTNGDTSTSEGNGIDLLLYAGAGIPTEGPPSTEGPPPTGVSEPGTLALFAAGLAGLGFARRRRARA